MSTTASTSGSRPASFGWVLVPLAFAQFIIALDIYIVFVALPEMGASLGFSDASLQLVVSAYAVAFGGFLLFGGRAADLLGRRRIFIVALGLYAVSSLIGGFASNPETIIVVRVVQGLGGALLFPATLSLINTLFDEGPQRNKALAVWGGAGASGLTLGSLLGGVLTGLFGWASVFFVNVPLALAIIFAAVAVIPRDAECSESRRRFDLPGALTATGGIALMVYVIVEGPVSGWGSPGIVAAAGISVTLLGIFLLIESRTADPLMPLRLLRNRSLVVAMTITSLFMATFGTLPYFMTVLFQQILGFSAMQTGLAFLVPALAIAIGTQIGERLATRFTTRVTLLIGFVIGSVGTIALAFAISADDGYAPLVPGLVVGMGIGQGIVWTGMWIAAASGVAPREQGVASGMASTTQQTGYAVGLAILVAIANMTSEGLVGDEALRTAAVEGTRLATYLIAGGIALGALVALRMPGKPNRTIESDIASASMSKV